MTQTHDAGLFLEWLESTRQMLRGRQHADVPCGECVGCCVSSYPIPLRPADRVALERVPSIYLHLPVKAGSLARMGFQPDGTCPFLCDSKCTIYADRPQTCRDYDCRIYVAAGLVPDGDRPVISERVSAWRFRFESEAAVQLALRLKRLVEFIRQNAAQFPPGLRANSAVGAALMGIKSLETDREELPLKVSTIIQTVREFDTSP